MMSVSLVCNFILLQVTFAIEVEQNSLNILVLSLPTVGHLNPALAYVDEAQSRGHRVTVCIGPAANDFLKFSSNGNYNYKLFESNVTNNLVEKKKNLTL